MVKYIIVCVLLAASNYLAAQNILVCDKNGQAIEHVIVVGDNFSTHTLPNGNLNFFPDEGTTKVTFIHPNYKRVSYSWEQLVNHNFVIILEERNLQLSEVVIRPLKRTQHLSDIPQKVVSLTPDDTKLYQPQTTADLLGNSSEVFIQKSQMGGGSPMIRGFSANRILMVIDGVRLNNAIYRSGNLHNVISLDAQSLEQTDIILGPGSVIYGSDALGGVLHFYTLKPRLETLGDAHPLNTMVRYSSANFEKTASVNYQLGGKKWAFVSSFTFSDFNHLIMGNVGNNAYARKNYVKTDNGNDLTIINSNPNEQLFTAYSQLNTIQKIRFRPNAKADFEYAFHFSRSSNIPRYDRLIENSGENPKFAEWYYGPQQWLLHSFKAELRPTGKIVDALNIQLAYQDFTESRHDRRFGQKTLNSRVDNVDIFSLTIDADKYLSSDQTIYYGIEGLYNKVHSTGFATQINTAEKSDISTRYPDGSNWWSASAYVMYMQTINEKVSMQAGTRYNYSGMNGKFDTRFFDFPFKSFSNSDGAATASFGMVINPNQKLRLNLNAASGFRAPNIDDAAKVFDSEPGNVIVPNPNLSPEYASSIESGFLWQPVKNFSIDFTLFYTRLFNAMVRRDGQLNGLDSIMYEGELSKVRTIVNTSWANIGGISGSLIYSPFVFITLKGNLNWQTGSDDLGLPLRHIAPFFGNFHAIYSNNKFQFDGYAILNGSVQYEKLAPDEREKPHLYAVDDNGNPYSPAWWTLNCKTSFRVSEKINLGAGIENILNIRYRPYSSGIVAPGLNLVLSASIRL